MGRVAVVERKERPEDCRLESSPGGYKLKVAGSGNHAGFKGSTDESAGLFTSAVSVVPGSQWLTYMPTKFVRQSLPYTRLRVTACWTSPRDCDPELKRCWWLKDQ